MVFTPPQSPLVWNHSADDILKLTKEAIEYDRALQDKVGGLDPKDCTFDSVSCNVLKPRNQATKECLRLGIRKSNQSHHRVLVFRDEYAYLFYYQLTLVSGDARIDVITRPLAFYRNVSPTKELRDASNEAESLLNDFGVECSMRLDVFKAKVAAKKNAEASGQWDKLSPEQQRLVDKMVDHFILLSPIQANRNMIYRS